MNRIFLAAILPAALLGSQVQASDTTLRERLRVESEAQFVSDYGDRIERMGPGVYLVTRGPMAGNTVTIGRAGLSHDLAALRARMPVSLRERRELQAQIKQLESIQIRYAQLDRLERTRSDSTVKSSSSAAFPCGFYDFWENRYIHYYASGYVQATTEYYMSNGGGGLNPYYARASASAYGYVTPPFGVHGSNGNTAVNAFVKNNQTGETVQRGLSGGSSGAETGYIYSGPAFSHDLKATATVVGYGDCAGYLSVSDTTL